MRLDLRTHLGAHSARVFKFPALTRKVFAGGKEEDQELNNLQNQVISKFCSLVCNPEKLSFKNVKCANLHRKEIMPVCVCMCLGFKSRAFVDLVSSNASPCKHKHKLVKFLIFIISIPYMTHYLFQMYFTEPIIYLLYI